MEKLNELIKQVGRPYEMFNEDGTYQGCFYPAQFLYPDKPRYKLRSDDDDKNYHYGMAKLRKHCRVIDVEELKAGDVIATRFKNELHIAIFMPFGRIIHVFRNNTLQIGRLKMFKEFVCLRVL